MRTGQNQRVDAGRLQRRRIFGNSSPDLGAVKLLAFDQRHKLRAGLRIDIRTVISCQDRGLMRTAVDRKFSGKHADLFPAAGGKYQLRAFRHPHDLKSMAAFKCVHTQNSQRVAGNDYQLHPAAVKIINDLTYKPAYFGFTAGSVRRTRRIAHINKILLRQRRLQTF